MHPDNLSLEKHVKSTLREAYRGRTVIFHGDSDRNPLYIDDVEFLDTGKSRGVLYFHLRDPSTGKRQALFSSSGGLDYYQLVEEEPAPTERQD